MDTRIQTSPQPEPSLDDRFELEDGRVFLNGIQALIRLMIDQQRRDGRAGLRTGGFVTGYPGSPLGGIDVALRGVSSTLKKYEIRHLPAQNEELAATSIMGTQMLDDHPTSEYDGVVSYWYGKGPGVDRAGDAIKHGNFAGTSKQGAVVILSGEDHEAKSSSVPYQQEFSFEHSGVPVLYPSSVAEFLEFGHHAVAMSRYSGCWVALKLVAPLCDGGATIDVSASDQEITIPQVDIDGKPFAKTTDFTFFPVKNIAHEKRLYEERHTAVRAYARANGLDRITVRSDQDRLGIVSSGKSYADVRQALLDLGFDDARLNAAGIRLLKVGLLCPIDEEIVREFADGLEEIIVVEEKRDFLERQVGRAILDLGQPIRLFGKKDAEGNVLFPVAGGLEPHQVTEILSGQLHARGLVDVPSEGGATITRLKTAQSRQMPHLPHRKPNFCSGCPHNIGTRLADGQQAWGSPGCHIFAALMDEPKRRIEAVTQYGGEGLPWIGLEPFTDRKHIVQNVGDGSLFHSSYLNIRYAVNAGATMTFKILYNSAIANTGGQPPVSATEIPRLLQLLRLEGVSAMVVVTKDRTAYRSRDLPSGTKVCEPPQMEAELKRLEAAKGVTVLVYDGQCANERRRRQKRGLQPKPREFTVVNEEVCENCGHCGEVANCMSLQKIDTPFGQKTRIHQSSCNQDQSCLEGECPSFVTVRTKEGGAVKKPAPPHIEDEFPEPELPSLHQPFPIYTPGLGGTGVITVNAILAHAATLDGNRALSYDQTGASQKWGAVLSSLIVARDDETNLHSNVISPGGARLYLALDLMAAGDAKNLARCSPNDTATVINTSLLPSGDMIRNVRKRVPADPMAAAVRTVCDPERTIQVPAREVAEAMFGDYMMTNMIAVGAAYQAGFIPITSAAIEQAVRLNGVQIEKNMLAFRAGRLAVHDRKAFDRLLQERPPALFANRTVRARTERSSERTAEIAELTKGIKTSTPTAARIADLTDDLVSYQNRDYAKRYIDVLRRVSGREAATVDGDSITAKVAVNLHKLMAFKDEYEVARLLSQPDFVENVKEAFDGAEQVYFNLQPPLLRWFGMKKKVRFNTKWAVPMLRQLARMKVLRGSVFDPFGYAGIRREERRLVGWYIALMDRAMGALSPTKRDLVLQLAALPEDIRGYEHIKERYLSEIREREAKLLAQLEEPDTPHKIAAE
ncbi:MAG: indolepyruvate ferredoxin oxidoreductase family protein [Roseitalea sp.]|jgi:indolepyruvate ferredoxin oxidoreductase|nr:indolepyruvate ferredoxin oxidoreductase family protein [Roseitalea sp.]MBO6720453.1 indolepyruvate ferredoxin oxidoreductase family protein [Roseitalea sp.]MBO6742813.1 indolepyruvate ferredoxin oxidoreductase family protein [Roseitalea sp.]